MGYDSKAPRPNRRLRDYESLYNNLLHRNRHPVEISYEEFYIIVEGQKCHYCNSDLDMPKYRQKGKSTASCLDRKNTDKPYSVDNTVPCCPKCNYGKGKWYSYEEWIEVGKTLESIYKTNKL